MKDNNRNTGEDRIELSKSRTEKESSPCFSKNQNESIDVRESSDSFQILNSNFLRSLLEKFKIF